MRTGLSVAITGIILAGYLQAGGSGGGFLEDFETGSKGTYNAATVLCSEGPWLMDDFLIGSLDNDKRRGLKAVRGCGTLQMEFDKPGGAASVSLWHAMYGNDNKKDVSWVLEISTDGGYSWDAFQSEPQQPDATLQQVTFDDINLAGNLRLRVVATGATKTKRINIDDIAITDFQGPCLLLEAPGVEAVTTRLGTPAPPWLFVLAGEFLSGAATVAAPVGFEVSLSSNANYSSSLVLPITEGNLAATPLFVRLSGSQLGDFLGELLCSSPGAADLRHAVSGTVVANRLPEIEGVPESVSVLYGAEVSFSVRISDPDGSISEVTVSSTSIPDATALLSTTLLDGVLVGNWCWQAELAGSHTLLFSACDNEGATVTATVEIEVGPDPAIAIYPGRRLKESFDSLGGTAVAELPLGWRVFATNAVRVVGTVAAANTFTTQHGGTNISSSATHGVYNFGAGDKLLAGDRAIGFISSGNSIGSGGTKSGSLMLCLVNRGVVPLKKLEIAYDIEKYRDGKSKQNFCIELLHSGDGVTWQSAGASFRREFEPDETNNGYDEVPGTTQNICDTLTELQIAPNARYYFAWHYSVVKGADGSSAPALAIDNVDIYAPMPPQTVLLVR